MRDYKDMCGLKAAQKYVGGLFWIKNYADIRIANSPCRHYTGWPTQTKGVILHDPEQSVT